MAETGNARPSFDEKARSLRAGDIGKLNVLSLIVYTYYTSIALATYDGEPSPRATVVKSIANSEFILSVVMAFLRPCVEVFSYNHTNDPRMYGDATTVGEVKEAEKVIGRMTPTLSATRAFIERKRTFNLIAGCEFEEAIALMAVAVSKGTECS